MVRINNLEENKFRISALLQVKIGELGLQRYEIFTFLEVFSLNTILVIFHRILFFLFELRVSQKINFRFRG